VAVPQVLLAAQAFTLCPYFPNLPLPKRNLPMKIKLHKDVIAILAMVLVSLLLRLFF
jgi:hypothetical protein